MSINARLFWVALAVLAGGTATAEDWPSFMGPHGDRTLNEKGLADEWPKEGPKLLWENKEIRSGFGCPVVAGGRVLVMDRAMDLTIKDRHGKLPQLNEAKFLPGPDVLNCLDRNTGKLLWKHEFNTLTDTKPTAWNTPTVEGEVLYARGGDGQVRCLSVKDGKNLWMWPKEGEAPFANSNKKMSCYGVPTAASVVICDDMLIVLGGHEGYASMLVGLDKKTGAKKWEHAFSDWLHGANNYTVLELGSRRVIAIFGEIIDPNSGAKLSTFETSPPGMSFWSRAWKGNRLYSGFIRVSGQHAEGILCQEFLAKPDGTVERKEVWRWLPPLTIEQQQKEKLEKSFTGPLLVDGYLYVFMGAKGCGSSVYCVDAATGKDVWPDRAKTWHGYMSPIYADGKIYYSEMGDTLFMFAADPKAYRPLGSAKVLNAGWSSPSISDGCLFNRGDLDGLKCIDLRATRQR